MTAEEAGMPSVPQDTTTCCIVGCGPAGAMLGLLLARAGVAVLVLEKHSDFFRDFRGDTIHGPVMPCEKMRPLLAAPLGMPA